MSTIVKVTGCESEEVCYAVGCQGVTKIKQGSYSPEPYCERIYYQVYKGDHLHAIVNDHGVAEVVFADPD